MDRLLLFRLVLGLALLITPLTVAPTALADDDNNESAPEQGIDPTFDTPTVNGVIYEVREAEGAQVVTVFDRDTGEAGLGVDVYVRDPALVDMVKNRTLCVGRYVEFEGIRTSPKTLDAQGVWVDQTTACHTPADAS